MTSDVAVAIGNHQGEQVLRDCLESLDAQTRRPAEIVVVDGGSTDGSRDVATEFGVRFLPAPNHGLGFLYNRGVEATQAEHVLLLNNDVALDPDCIQLLSARLAADSACFSADPTQLDWSGRHVIHAQTTLRRGRLVREFIPGLHLDSNVARAEVVPTVSSHGAAMLVRRSMFVELGGFDETFFMEWEDLDLCWRAWLRDWSSVYVPQARVRHRVGAVTGKAVLPRRSASSHHNLVRFALKCLPAAPAARVVGGELLRLPRHPRAIGSGLARVPAELPAILRIRRSLAPNRRVFEELLAL